MKGLPIGINTLRTIIEADMVYIDKTEIAYKMIKQPARFFLSRPRRFGKSLFLDTLKEIYEGSKELFKGLYIYDKWNWGRKFPVIKIDFAGGVVNSAENLNILIQDKFDQICRHFEINLKAQSISGKFSELIEILNAKFNSKVVVLIDEYDKPLLDNIENSEKVIEIKEGLKNFYSVMKEQDANIEFVFFTGVSKFSKVNIFSGINNLNDITIDKDYATVCGYTQDDLETTFSEHLEGVDRNQLKEWYNGYNYTGENVYNPFDILLFISKGKEYRNYWFETGTPTFLVKLFQKNNYFLPDLEEIEVGEELLSSFEIEKIEPTTLLFQSGYLTIKDYYTKREKLIYKLGFPNREVKLSLNEHLITGLTNYTIEKERYEDDTYNALVSGDLAALEKTIKRLFAGISYRNFTNNNISEFEGYYASVLYAFFSAINCQIIPEDITNRGQADMTVKLNSYVFVMEIKVIKGVVDLNQRGHEEHGEERETKKKKETKNDALRQIQELNYAAKYIGQEGVSVFEVGMIFSMAERNLVAFDWVKK